MRTAAALAGRSLALIPRVPSTFIPSLVFPVFVVVGFSGAFSAIAQLPGFPTDSMLDWMLPMAVIQGAAFAGITTGMGVARDIESRFFDRLLLAPVRPVALVAGPLAAAVFRAFIPFTAVLTVGVLSGAHLRGGLPGVLTLLVAAEGAALVAAGWGVGLALRLQAISKAAPFMQVGIFLAVFLSTAQVPLSVMTGWLHSVARINPMTNILALGRQGFIGDVTWDQTWPGLVAIGASAVVLTTFAVRGLRKLTP
jgi:ABC-2 type transport system permease protein